MRTQNTVEYVGPIRGKVWAAESASIVSTVLLLIAGCIFKLNLAFGCRRSGDIRQSGAGGRGGSGEHRGGEADRTARMEPAHGSVALAPLGATAVGLITMLAWRQWSIAIIV